MKLKNRLALLLLNLIVKQCYKDVEQIEIDRDFIMAKAYYAMIKSYKDSILYLEAQIK